MLRLEFENMNALRHVSDIYPIFLTPYLDYIRLKVPVIELPEKFLLAHLVHSENIANPRDQPASHLVKGRRDKLTRSFMLQLDPGAILREPVSVDVGHATLSLESGFFTYAKEKVHLTW